MPIASSLRPRVYTYWVVIMLILFEIIKFNQQMVSKMLLSFVIIFCGVMLFIFSTVVYTNV